MMSGHFYGGIILYAIITKVFLGMVLRPKKHKLGTKISCELQDLIL